LIRLLIWLLIHTKRSVETDQEPDQDVTAEMVVSGLHRSPEVN